MKDICTLPFVHPEMERIIRYELPVSDGSKLTSCYVHRGARRKVATTQTILKLCNLDWWIHVVTSLKTSSW